MEVRQELKYTEEHEWILISGTEVTLGITDFAQNKLGDIVFVELPEEGTIIDADETVGNIESVKAVSEIFCPIGGEILSVNKDLEEEPDLVNSAPYDEGWMIKLKIDPADLELAKLMTHKEYQTFCAED